MIRKIAIFVAVSFLIPVALAGLALAKHAGGVAEATARWEAHEPTPLRDIGSTRSLTILPLVDWHASRDDLQTAMGVSYLVKTDELTILFDTGNGPAEGEGSPLEHNMAALGVSVDDLDGVFISHAHFDHIGGMRWSDGEISGATFGIGSRQPDLSGKTTVVPVPMTYPGIEPTLGADPLKLAPGVATTGTIPRKLLLGFIDEQALVVNVEGKGLVIIVGCGHQTLPRLVQRVEAVFDEPIYGVIGGLHYPVPDGRMVKAGLNVQRLAASGDGPLSPMTREEAHAELGLLEDRKVGVIGIGGHDSSDEVIAAAAERFGEAYRRVEVGLPIVID